jgi:hypothetical protein
MSMLPPDEERIPIRRDRIAFVMDRIRHLQTGDATDAEIHNAILNLYGQMNEYAIAKDERNRAPVVSALQTLLMQCVDPKLKN